MLIPGPASGENTPPAESETVLSAAVVSDDAFQHETGCNCDPQMLIHVETDCDPDFCRVPPIQDN